VTDVRYALRSLRNTPVVSATAVVSLALGIAALTTMGSSIDALLLRPFPYDLESQLVYLGTAVEGRGAASSPTSVPDFLDLRGRSRAMEVSAYRNVGVNLAGDPTEWLGARRVSANFFSVVGVEPLLGRSFLPEEETVGSPEVAMLGHTLWERRFGGDPTVLGSVIGIDDASATVVGILPPGFEFGFGSPELWLPLRLSAAESRNPRTLAVVARIRGTFDAARAELNEIASALAAAYPATNGERSFRINGMRDELFGGPAFQQGAIASSLGALFVLLIACLNVANLLLARGTGRAGEIALRRALGASRQRILRQLLAEAGVLALGAGVLGVLLSILGMRGLEFIIPPGLPRGESIGLDSRTVAFGAAISLGSILLFALLPALHTIRGGTRDRLAGRGGAMGRRTGRLRTTLVAAEITLAAVLLTTTALVLRSVRNLAGVDPGFDPAGVVTFALNFPEGRYGDDDRLREALRTLESELTSVPGVTSVGLGTGVPTRGGRTIAYQIAGTDDSDADAPRRAFGNYWSSEYAPAIGLEVLSGRGMNLSDDATTAEIAVVNRAFARYAWPDEEPLGRTLLIDDRLVQVVGVVEDVLEFGLQGNAPAAIYLPMAQWSFDSVGRSVRVVLRHAPGGDVRLAQTRAAVGRVDSNLAVADFSTLEAVLRDSAEQFDSLGRLLATLALVALLLATVGVYASIAYTVARRVPEIGVRMAMGADAGSVQALVLKRAAVVAGFGIVVGLGLAILAARGVRAFLFGVGGVDAVAFAGVVGVLLTVTLLAAWVPARRAASIDPVVALRSE
jgi:putative ABC transport system permease protein